MRTKIVHGIDDNVHIDRWLVRNEELPDSDPYKLSEDEFCGRWLALKPNSSSYENFEPCMNCLYYGEFETIDDSLSDVFERCLIQQHPPRRPVKQYFCVLIK